MFNKEPFTLDKFQCSMKSRNIWLNNFKSENMRIKSLLADAFYPYQCLIQRQLKELNEDSNYEIDSYLCIKDEPRLSIEVNDWFGTNTTPYIEISLYFLPKNLEDSDLPNPQVSLGFHETIEIEKIIEKFSLEIKMKTKIIYE